MYNYCTCIEKGKFIIKNILIESAVFTEIVMFAVRITVTQMLLKRNASQHVQNLKLFISHKCLLHRKICSFFMKKLSFSLLLITVAY